MFIAGYTLSIDGYFLGTKYEKMGTLLMAKCAEISNSLHLQKLANHFLINQHAHEALPITARNLIVAQLFAGDSLVEKYFREVI